MRKAWIRQSLAASGAVRLVARVRGAAVVILMYHSVMDDPGRDADTLGDNIHSAEVFRRHMEILSHRYSPVSMDDVLQFVRGEKRLPAGAVAVTFDDGYADNLEVAAPMLNRLGIPSTVYVTVDAVERAMLPFPARLRHAFMRTRVGSWVDSSPRMWPLTRTGERGQALRAAQEHCARLAGETQELFLVSVERALDVEAPRTSLMMTWDQVRQFARQGHAVGSHTMTHPNIAHVEEADVERELAESRRRLEEQLSSPVVHFAYPGPALTPIWSERSLAVCRGVGYETAVTTTYGVVRRGDHPLCLRRLGARDDADGFRWDLERVLLSRAR